jgi:hypothetical protein
MSQPLAVSVDHRRTLSNHRIPLVVVHYKPSTDGTNTRMAATRLVIARS